MKPYPQTHTAQKKQSSTQTTHNAHDKNKTYITNNINNTKLNTYKHTTNTIHTNTHKTQHKHNNNNITHTTNTYNATQSMSNANGQTHITNTTQTQTHTYTQTENISCLHVTTYPHKQSTITYNEQ